MAGTRFLVRSDLDRLFDALSGEGRRVLGPTVVDGAVVYDEIGSAAELPVGWRSESAPGEYRLSDGGGERAFDYGVALTAWKRFTHPSFVPLTRATSEGGSVTVVPVVEPAPQVAFLGVRACELAALGIQDRAMRAGPLGDADHAARRDAALVVAVECASATSTCFCTSMGTGPEVRDGADLVLAELDDGFTVRAGSPAGTAILERLDLPAATDDDEAAAIAQVAAVRATIGDPVATEGLPERLRGALDHPRWAEVAERCLACANCTLVCPTCFCTSVSVASDLDGIDGSTAREWDSCFSLGFGRVAGDANFRGRTKDRYRQWLTHKFSTWWDQFGSSGCVGCGRCIAWCPVGIDVREELAAVAPVVRVEGPHPVAALAGRGSRAGPAGARRTGDPRDRHGALRGPRRPSIPSRCASPHPIRRCWTRDPGSSSWSNGRHSPRRRSRSPGSARTAST